MQLSLGLCMFRLKSCGWRCWLEGFISYLSRQHYWTYNLANRLVIKMSETSMDLSCRLKYYGRREKASVWSKKDLNKDWKKITFSWMKSGLGYASRAGPHLGGSTAVTALSPHKQSPIMPLPLHTTAQRQLLLKRHQSPYVLHKGTVPKKLILAWLQAQHVPLRSAFLG